MIAAGLAAFASSAALAADEPAPTGAKPPPAGQMCPPGAYVIGFDEAGNIVCSAMDRAADCAEACPPAAAAAAPAAATVQEAPEAAAPPAAREAAAPQAGQGGVPNIDKLKPWSVPWGTNEITVTIIGSGFTADSQVGFLGATYSGSVNPQGTELRVTLRIRGLAIGNYPVTVSNGPGASHTLKKALSVY